MKVVDASIALKWVYDEEAGTEAARALLKSPEDLLAPSFWTLEAANGLWKRQRKALISAEEAGMLLDFLLSLPVRTVHAEELASAALKLSIELKHPVYDCSYLALALQEKVPLVTADTRFASVLRGSGYERALELIGPDQP